jgi:hypothetical protein
MTFQILEPTLLSLTAIVVLGALAAYGGEAPPAALPAAPSGARIERTSWAGWSDAYRLTNGTIEMVVVPASGRILHYGYTGAANLLWQNASAGGRAPVPGAWTNYGGSKTWIWPQEDWPARTGSGWPPPTDLPTTIIYTVEVRDKGTLRLISPALPGYDAVIVRDIHIEDSGTRVFITSRLQKTGADATFAMAPWTVTQMPADGSLFARLMAGSRLPEGYRAFPGGSFKSVSLEGRDILAVERQRTTSAKIGADADLLAWQRDEILFVERSVNGKTPLSAFAVGDAGQLYSHPDGDPTLPAGVSYIEMELTAPLRTLRSGESTSLETIWELVHLAPDERTRSAVAALLRKM